MLPKYFTLILTFFYCISPERRDLLGFYCRASIACNIILSTSILTPSFSSPILEENAVKVCTISFERPEASPERLQSECNYRPFIT